jgi:nucleoside-diphosphate-sugar epimerase
MKVLITGGAGFLGLHLAAFLEKKGYDLTLVDIQTFDKKEYPGKYKLIVADVRNRKKMETVTKGQDIIIHAAAALPLSKKKDIYSVNIDGTRNMLEAATKHRARRFIHISSTAVYGVPKKHPIIEDYPLIGVGPYGDSKIQAEKLCLAAIKKGYPVTILRPKTFVGGGRLGVFEILFDWIHDGKRIPVIGNGKNRYQLLDVDDLVYATYLFLSKSSSKYNDFFNIGAARFKTVREDLQEVFDFARSGSIIFPTPAFPVKKALFLFEKLGISPLYQWVYDTADRDSFVSIDKLTKVLGWKPKYSNSDALIKAYKWYQIHYDQIKAKSPGITHTVGWDQGILKVFKKFL